MHNKILHQKPMKEQEKLIFLYCVVDDLLKYIIARSYFPKLRGKSTVGWFYGFKLYIICNQIGKLKCIKIIPANVYDGHMVKRIAKDIFGKIVADAGYLGVKSELETYDFG